MSSVCPGSHGLLYLCVLMTCFYSAGVVIGFEQTEYTVTEGTDTSLEICAIVMSGTLDRNAVVMFSTSNGAATTEGGSTLLTGTYQYYCCIIYWCRKYHHTYLF